MARDLTDSEFGIEIWPILPRRPPGRRWDGRCIGFGLGQGSCGAVSAPS